MERGRAESSPRRDAGACRRCWRVPSASIGEVPAPQCILAPSGKDPVIFLGPHVKDSHSREHPLGVQRGCSPAQHPLKSLSFLLPTAQLSPSGRTMLEDEDGMSERGLSSSRRRYDDEEGE